MSSEITPVQLTAHQQNNITCLRGCGQDRNYSVTGEEAKELETLQKFISKYSYAFIIKYIMYLDKESFHGCMVCYDRTIFWPNYFKIWNLRVQKI